MNYLSSKFSRKHNSFTYQDTFQWDYIEGFSKIHFLNENFNRATINYGRKGLPLQAISAVDLAIWDLLGKLRNEPVYALLGGKTKDQLPVYMSVNTLQTLLSCLCLLNTFDVYEYAAGMIIFLFLTVYFVE